MTCPSKIIQQWFSCLSSKFSSRLRKLSCMGSLACYKCPWLCLSSPFHQGSMDRIGYAEKKESVPLASCCGPLMVRCPGAQNFILGLVRKDRAHVCRLLPQYYILDGSVGAVTFGSIPCQHLINNYCQMLARKPAKCYSSDLTAEKKCSLKKPFATELLSDMPALKLQGTPVGTNCRV